MSCDKNASIDLNDGGRAEIKATPNGAELKVFDKDGDCRITVEAGEIFLEAWGGHDRPTDPAKIMRLATGKYVAGSKSHPKPAH